ncbi:DEAD/DEAH box helicase family protein [Cryptosporidium muris RN66]|uniref:DEAD/DEAH box helicase family protein n=1 Tax=Cryptosporidium muris (strain RN66) TaxID=441375 RepID=B6AD69_CRYMR|nr:DEAD/DEAH box helicase family protein [Cryptosporidium muris RN66]EEA06073.1 DEAD/DEAH box helicase family protein [Cryptosporidium muris RN66]|eukprot:XP_002140422.1 DEAD/DEAH box helicase family protein [Cryptosporidium muris RN66]
MVKDESVKDTGKFPHTEESLTSNKTMENITFASLGVCKELCLACESLGWLKPTDIQREAIPIALRGGDIIGLAETGSGKTGAFILPILQSLLENQSRMYSVVLAPTRELCVQISEQFSALGSLISLQVANIVGGMDMVNQALSLAKKPHIIVASPGRLVDHLENTKGFNISSVKYLVMDEADRLLSMDFEIALTKIIEACPKNRNTYLFSATMTTKVAKLQRVSLKNPVKICVNTKYDTAENLLQYYMFIPFKFKWSYLVILVQNLSQYTGIIFTNTCISCKRGALLMQQLGFSSVCLHGRMNQTQRLAALNQFKSKQRHLLFTTEVGSRGLDIPHVDFVINFDIPMSSKDYVHRVGRTARAGRSGKAISLVTQYDVEMFQRVEFALNKKLDEYSDINKDQMMAIHGKVLEALRITDIELSESNEKSNLVGSRKTNKKYKRR